MADKPKSPSLEDIAAELGAMSVSRPGADVEAIARELGATSVTPPQTATDVSAIARELGATAVEPAPNRDRRQAPWSAAYPKDQAGNEVAGPPTANVYADYLRWKAEKLPWYERADVAISDNIGGWTRSLYNATASALNSVVGTNVPQYSHSEYFKMGIPVVSAPVDMALSIAMSPTDPLGTLAGNKIAKGISKAPGFSKLFNTSDELARTFAQAKYEVENYGDIAEGALKLARNQYLRSRIMTSSISAATEGAIMGATQDLADSTEKGFDFERTAATALFGAGLGGVLGAAAGRWLPDDAQMARVQKHAVETVKEKYKGTADAVTNQMSMSFDDQLGSLRHQLETVNSELEATITKAAGIETGAQKFGPDLSADQGAALVKTADELEKKIADLSTAKQEILSTIKDVVGSNPKVNRQASAAKEGISRAAYVDEAQRASEKTVKSLIDRGIIDPQHGPAYMSEIFNAALDARPGIKNNAAFSGGRIQDAALSMTRTTELMNRIDRMYGTQTTGLFADMINARAAATAKTQEELSKVLPAIKALRSKGWADVDITRALTYVDNAGNLQTNALNSAKQTRDAFPLGANKFFTLDMLEKNPELRTIREFLVQHRQGEINRGVSMGMVETGYVPLYQRRDAPVSSVSPRATAVDATAEKFVPSATLKRQQGKFDPNIHETDPVKWLFRYVNEASKQEYTAPLLDRFARETFKVAELSRARNVSDPNQVRALDSMLKTFAEGMGLKNVNELKVKLADRFVNKHMEILSLASRFADDGANYDDWLKVAQKIQYTSLVLKPINFIQNQLQPVLVGSAEVGLGNISRGLKAYWFKDKEAQRALASVKGLLTNTELDEYRSLLGVDKSSSTAANVVNKILDTATALPMKQWSRDEARNRAATFLGGWLQFKDAAKAGPQAIDRALDGLLTGQREMVLRAYREGGEEAGARMYGLVRNARANFVFDALDKPSALRGPALNLVPFTTWTTNQLARFVTDAGNVARGDASLRQPVARYVIPTLALAAFSEMTGFQLPNSNPIDAAIDGTAPQLSMPVLGAAAQTLSTGKVDKLVGLIPGVGTAVKTRRLIDKGTPASLAILGLEQDKREFADKLSPRFVQKIRERFPQNTRLIKKTFGQ